MRWLRSNLCMLCVDPNDVTSYFTKTETGIKPKLNSDEVTKFKLECEGNYKTMFEAEEFLRGKIWDFVVNYANNPCSD